MTISTNGLAFIEQFEGFRSTPYADSNGKPTIGIGTTIYPNGMAVTLLDAEISEETAREYLAYHLDKRVYPVLEKYTLNQNQLDSLCSFVYNEGAGNFNISNLKLRLDCDINDPAIRDEFSRWVYCNHKVLEGLVKRRKAEADLYFS